MLRGRKSGQFRDFHKRADTVFRQEAPEFFITLVAAFYTWWKHRQVKRQQEGTVTTMIDTIVSYHSGNHFLEDRADQRTREQSSSDWYAQLLAEEDASRRGELPLDDFESPRFTKEPSDANADWAETAAARIRQR